MTHDVGQTTHETMAICMCTFNRGLKILPTLHALAGQDRAGGRITRILVVDNGSHDETPEIVSRFIAEHADAQMQLVIEPNPGKSEAIRRAFATTDEPVVAFTDDDCLPSADWASSLLSAIDAQPRAGIVGGLVRIAFESGPTRVARRYIATFGPQDFGPVRCRLNGIEEFLTGMSQAIRRQAMLESHWLDQGQMTCLRGAHLTGGEDVELSYMVKAAGWQLWYEPNAIMQHVISPVRQTRSEIARRRHSMATTEPMLKWLAHNKPDAAWVNAHLAKANKRYLKALLLEWRPTRRAIRLARIKCRCKGWTLIAEQLNNAS